MTRYCGRDFNTEDIDQIRTLIREDPARTRADLSRLTCQILGWHKPNAGLKDMACRVVMLRMQEDGLIQLPPPRGPKPHCKIALTAHTEAQPPLTQPVHTLPSPNCNSSRAQTRACGMNISSATTTSAIRPSQVHSCATSLPPVTVFSRCSGSAPPPGKSHPAIASSAGATPNAKKSCISWVNNARFLILPWVQSKGLASKVLALAAKQLPHDWVTHYGYRPVLLETFVDGTRFRGTCYQAANWTHVGQTKGRGKLGPSGKQSVPIKAIWLYPLTRHFQQLLNT